MTTPVGAADRRFSLWDLRGYLRPRAAALAAASLLMSIDAVVLLVAPWPLKFIIDSVILKKPLPHWLAGVLPDPASHGLLLLNIFGLAMLAFGIADSVLTYCGNRLLLRTGQLAIFDIRRDLFAHLQRLSLSFHHRQKSGDIMARLGGDIQTLQDFVVSAGTGLFAHLLTTVGMAVVMLTIDWRFALVIMAVLPIMLFVMQRYRSLIKRSFRVARRREGALWGKVQEILANIHIVQAYGRESQEDSRFVEQAGKSLEATIRASDLQAQFPPLVGLVMALATAAATWYGATRVLAGSITAGEILVFLAYLRGMASPVRQFAKMAGVVSKASVAAERLGDIFNETSEIHDSPDAVSPARCTGDLQFDSVCFGYRPDKLVLQDVSFHAKPAQTIALVGATGAGKSTLSSMVSRFHDPLAGRILLDGHDLRELSLAFVRRQVALVLQEALVFSGTIWENIAYGLQGAGRSEAIVAARSLGIDGLIEKLPDSYDTLVEERGTSLSGGQRQCISIARAMLRDAPVVILDEPTSGLDAFTERVVMEALRRLTEGRTTLIIAHRLATIVRADQILVLDHGRVVQTGTHEQLLAAKGRYRELWNGGTGGIVALQNRATDV
jgi:ATP-binding cassette subfamily B protein/subfamily B ATP-binding cassette protein MsbA